MAFIWPDEAQDQVVRHWAQIALLRGTGHSFSQREKKSAVADMVEQDLISSD